MSQYSLGRSNILKNKLNILLSITALVLAAFACSLFETEMSLENLHLATDENGENRTTVFESTDVFYAVADLNNAPAGTVAAATWLVVQVEGYDANEVIYEQIIDNFSDENFTGIIFFQLSNDDGWPAGEYKVDVYINNTFLQSANFSVH